MSGISMRLKASNSNTEGDCTDLVDIFAFFWNAKILLIVGLLLGGWLGWQTGDSSAPTTTTRRFPLKATYPPGQNLESIKIDLAQVVSSPELAKGFFTKLRAENNSSVNAYFARQGYDESRFVNLMRSEGEPRPVAITFSNNWQLVTNVFSHDNDAAVSEALTTSYLEFFASYVAKSAKKPDGRLESRMASPEFSRLQKITIERRMGLWPIQRKLYVMENRLLERLRGKSAFSQSSNSEDQILKLVAILLEENRITAAEADVYLREHTNLVSQIEMETAFYQQEYSQSYQEAINYSKKVRLASKAPELPTFAVDNELLATMKAAGTFEYRESKKLKFAAVGGLMGMLLGAITFSLMSYANRNRKRILQIVQKP